MKTSSHVSARLTKIIILIFLGPLSLNALAQEARATRNAADSVVIPLAGSSRIIFTVGDSADLDVLRHYNFQEMFDDILQQLRKSHGMPADTAQEEERHAERETPEAHEPNAREQFPDEEHDDQDHADEGNDDARHHHKWHKSRRGNVGQTWQSYNLDVGTNNYLSGDQFPDGSEPYAVRPWGSWYLGINSVQRTRLARNVFVEWGLGVSWYSFKFQEDNILVQKETHGLAFIADSRDVTFVKSKLGATFINASLVPVLDFGDHSRRRRIWDGHADGFRFGIGPYVGYRIASKTKLVYETGDDRQKDKDRDGFYLNNLRYGLRLQIGVRATDLFVNYDLNELFASGKGPELNAVSFGLIF